ncbi:pyruvate,water dikinase [Kribbella steppae]|uniref:Pyruvate,water dikinase n=1 Tax=Kribbella steppae TaxID=2512223 RepID=A0A4R2H9W2_9ACTN|nr:PEP/pyruvate-binding domain-containing protein [Kribbella steppae]TCO23485.1 pyruvate,water dikinase [Kribbella steppae]
MIVSLTEATRQQAGGKAAVLGALARAGFPVPPGFVVPTEVYRAVTSGLDLAAVDGPDEVRRLIESRPLPAELARELTEAMTRLGGNAVAVRSSASTEDTVGASAAGQHDSYLGVTGSAAVIERLPATWASLWSTRAVAYRSTAAVAPEMAVIVQRHIDAEVAGVLFTDAPGIQIEASWGLGESVVGGLVTPDSFSVSADGAVGRRTGDKDTRIDRSGNGTITTAVAPESRNRLCLDDQQLARLATLGRQVAEHLGAPQDIEFAIENDQIWLLQARPITAPLPHPADPPPTFTDLRGTAGSPGLVSGPARVVHGTQDFSRVGPGDILVCRFTDPAWTPLFGVVAGVVTETGGRLSHAAIVAREHRIPAVLGVPAAMTTLYDGQPLTLDGTTGTIRR